MLSITDTLVMYNNSRGRFSRALDNDCVHFGRRCVSGWPPLFVLCSYLHGQRDTAPVSAVIGRKPGAISWSSSPYSHTGQHQGFLLNCEYLFIEYVPVGGGGGVDRISRKWPKSVLIQH